MGRQGEKRGSFYRKIDRLPVGTDSPGTPLWRFVRKMRLNFLLFAVAESLICTI